MDKIKFIEHYKKKIDKICPEYKKEHFIDNDKIGCFWIKKWHYFDINKCLKIREITKEARQYIYNLKKGDKIEVYKYGNIGQATILKINYKRELDKKGNKIISSMTYKKIFDNDNSYSYESKLKIKEIVYKGNSYQDLFDGYLHFNGIFLSFSEYDIEKGNQILDNYLKLKDLQENKGV